MPKNSTFQKGNQGTKQEENAPQFSKEQITNVGFGKNATIHKVFFENSPSNFLHDFQNSNVSDMLLNIQDAGC